MDLGLDGKVVLVTGAASGIGRATAKAFAARRRDARARRPRRRRPEDGAGGDRRGRRSRHHARRRRQRQRRGRRRPRRGRRRARAHRRGLQQRGRDRARRLAARHPGRLLGPRDRRQPQGRLALHARPAAPHVRPPGRRDREHLVRRRAGRRARHEPLHDGQARGDRPHAHRGARVRDVRHPRQRRRPRHGADADERVVRARWRTTRSPTLPCATGIPTGASRVPRRSPTRCSSWPASGRPSRPGRRSSSTAATPRSSARSPRRRSRGPPRSPAARRSGRRSRASAPRSAGATRPRPPRGGARRRPRPRRAARRARP